MDEDEDEDGPDGGDDTEGIDDNSGIDDSEQNTTIDEDGEASTDVIDEGESLGTPNASTTALRAAEEFNVFDLFSNQSSLGIDGWSAGLPEINPYINIAWADGPLGPYVGFDSDPYISGEVDGTNINAYTGGRDVDPFTGTSASPKPTPPQTPPIPQPVLAQEPVEKEPLEPTDQELAQLRARYAQQGIRVHEITPEELAEIYAKRVEKSNTPTTPGSSTPPTPPPPSQLPSGPEKTETLDQMAARFAKYDSALASSQSVTMSSVSQPTPHGILPNVPTPSMPVETEDRSFWGSGGGTLVTGGIGLGVGIAILASNPIGWAIGLTAALAIASGATGVLVGTTNLATSGSRTPEQNEDLNRATNAALGYASSPGSMIGGTLFLLSSGNQEGLEKGSMYGGLAEAGGSLAYGVGNMAYREYRFSQVYSGSSYRWGSVRGPIQEAYGLGNAADRMRPNSLFYTGVERVDLSHFVPQRSIGGYERFFNRPWNVTPMWATDHAMVDSYRFSFMSSAFKAAYETQQLQGLERALNLASPWMLQAGYGAARGTQIYVGNQD